MLHNLNPNLLLGYHGCDKAIGEQILAGQPFKQSENDYDWLGPGIYFWESNPKRALSFAQEQVTRGRVKDPFVVGAVLSLGNCLDAMSEDSLKALTSAYNTLKDEVDASAVAMPVNDGGVDLLRRKLDCAVINTLHGLVKTAGKKIDSVRALYHEGGPLYPNAGFYSKSHVQIAVCNPDCIKGVFRVTL